MTDTDRPFGGDSGLPLSVDVLADLHAGALANAEAAELWSKVRADPEAMAVIAALDATTADLTAFGDAPAPPMPAAVAVRIDAALAEEAAHTNGARPAEAPVAPVVDLAAARRKRNRQLGWGAGLLTAAAAAVAAVVMVGPGATTPGTPVAEPPTESAPGGRPPLTLRGEDVAAGLGDTMNVRDYGPLTDQAGLDKCLQANDIDTENAPIGFRPATIDGKPAVLMVFTTGEFARYRIVAVPTDCGEGKAGLLHDETVGR